MYKWRKLAVCISQKHWKMKQGNHYCKLFLVCGPFFVVQPQTEAWFLLLISDFIKKSCEQSYVIEKCNPVGLSWVTTSVVSLLKSRERNDLQLSLWTPEMHLKTVVGIYFLLWEFY